MKRERSDYKENAGYENGILNKIRKKLLSLWLWNLIQGAFEFSRETNKHAYNYNWHAHKYIKTFKFSGEVVKTYDGLEILLNTKIWICDYCQRKNAK